MTWLDGEIARVRNKIDLVRPRALAMVYLKEKGHRPPTQIDLVEVLLYGLEVRLNVLEEVRKRVPMAQGVYR